MNKQTIIFLLAIFAVGCGAAETTGNEHGSHKTSSNNTAIASRAGVNAADHGTHGAGHSDMKSAPGAASAPFELQFLDSMIFHHQGAVEMAVLAESRADRAEIKELAASIVDEQEREIAKMTEWRDSWFDGKPAAINMEFPGMLRGMQGMDTKKLESLRGAAFDEQFVQQMIPHHEGAIEMANALKNGKARAELQELAGDIIAAQQAEIEQMRQLQSAQPGTQKPR